MPLVVAENASEALPPGPLEAWSQADVRAFLASEGFGPLADTFFEHEVTGMVLLSLSEDDLERSLGMTKFGQRRRLAMSVAQLQKTLADPGSGERGTNAFSVESRLLGAKRPLQPRQFAQARKPSLPPEMTRQQDNGQTRATSSQSGPAGCSSETAAPEGQPDAASVSMFVAPPKQPLAPEVAPQASAAVRAGQVHAAAALTSVRTPRVPAAPAAPAAPACMVQSAVIQAAPAGTISAVGLPPQRSAIPCVVPAGTRSSSGSQSVRPRAVNLPGHTVHCQAAVVAAAGAGQASQCFAAASRSAVHRGGSTNAAIGGVAVVPRRQASLSVERRPLSATRAVAINPAPLSRATSPTRLRALTPHRAVSPMQRSGYPVASHTGPVVTAGLGVNTMTAARSSSRPRQPLMPMPATVSLTAPGHSMSVACARSGSPPMATRQAGAFPLEASPSNHKPLTSAGFADSQGCAAMTIRGQPVSAMPPSFVSPMPSQEMASPIPSLCGTSKFIITTEGVPPVLHSLPVAAAAVLAAAETSSGMAGSTCRGSFGDATLPMYAAVIDTGPIEGKGASPADMRSRSVSFGGGASGNQWESTVAPTAAASRDEDAPVSSLPRNAAYTQVMEECQRRLGRVLQGVQRASQEIAHSVKELTSVNADCNEDRSLLPQPLPTTSSTAPEVAAPQSEEADMLQEPDLPPAAVQVASAGARDHVIDPLLATQASMPQPVLPKGTDGALSFEGHLEQTLREAFESCNSVPAGSGGSVSAADLVKACRGRLCMRKAEPPEDGGVQQLAHHTVFQRMSAQKLSFEELLPDLITWPWMGTGQIQRTEISRWLSRRIGLTAEEASAILHFMPSADAEPSRSVCEAWLKDLSLQHEVWLQNAAKERAWEAAERALQQLEDDHREVNWCELWASVSRWRLAMTRCGPASPDQPPSAPAVAVASYTASAVNSPAVAPHSSGRRMFPSPRGVRGPPGYISAGSAVVVGPDRPLAGTGNALPSSAPTPDKDRDDSPGSKAEDLRLSTWNEMQVSKHRQAKAWIVSRAVAKRGIGTDIQVRENAQMRALAREVDLEILNPIAATTRGSTPSERGQLDPEEAGEAAARLPLVPLYMDKLLEDTLDELGNRASGEGVLRVKDPPQAEASIRNYVRVLHEALISRLNSCMPGAAVGSWVAAGKAARR
eukprot:TRINITY_DN35506_c0_g1_i1.p1 TRINITY_DN35506_c0_g1~~TRINITY_DN35506_c0_g1_i1.p1  ORF type:complete len:1174 (+),score=202.74 TRINITY_DN35506_c0_g1_i1:163-3684(+)